MLWLKIKVYKINIQILWMSLISHTIFSVLSWFCFGEAFDAYFYYRTGMAADAPYAVGRYIVPFIVSITAYPLNATYLTTFIFFSVLGWMGIAFMYAAIVENIYYYNSKYTRRLLYIVLFIPGFNFWTSALGKDSLIFLGIGMLFFAVSRLEKRLFLLITSIVFIFQIRPHIASFAAIALILTLLVSTTIRLRYKIVVFSSITIASFLFFPFLLKWTAFIGFESISDFVAHRQTLINYGGSAVEIGKYPFIFQLFTYIYRPLFIDAGNIMMLATSVENALLLFLTINLISPYFCRYISRRATFLEKYAIIYFWILLIPLAVTTSNLGVAARQKYMFIPALFIVFVIYLSERKLKRRISYALKMLQDKQA